MGRLTAIFVQGLIALLPLAVTIAILWWLGVTAERTLGGAIRWALPEEWYVRGMGIAAGVIVIFLVGVLMNIYGVPKLIRLGEKFIGRIPLVKTVYGAVRDLLGCWDSSHNRAATGPSARSSSSLSARAMCAPSACSPASASMICRRDWVERATSSCSSRTATRWVASR
jgi:uncharacterized membrane protein